MRRPASLTRQVPLLLAVVAALTIVIAFLVSWRLIARASDGTVREALGRTAGLTAETLAGSIDDISGAPVRFAGPLSERLRLLLNQQQATGYLVLSGANVNLPLTSSDVAAVTSGSPVSVKRRAGGDTYFVEGRPIQPGVGVLLVQPSRVAEELAMDAFRRLALSLLLGLGVALLIGWWVARRVTRPLVDARNAANAMSSGQRDIRIDPHGPAEVADIAHALNRLAAALAESEGRQREFFLTVSHELRTPLTSLKGYSEALADGVVAAQEVPEVANIMRMEADHLDRLVADLLDLARLGAVDVRVEPVLTDLAVVGRDAAATWSGRALRAGVQFVDEVAPPPLWSRTDPIRVRQIIDNLMENAMRVTAEGAPVILRVAGSGDGRSALVQVRDGGPGLTDDDLRVAFEPGELHARYRGVRKVGSGVGLALVNRLAERLGGRAEAGAAPEGGASFTVYLPLEAGPSQPTDDRGPLAAERLHQG